MPIHLVFPHGKAHRKPTRSNRVKNKKKLRTEIDPGQVVSIDELFSPTIGFVQTHRGIPTTQRYIGTTVFVNHLSDFTYINLMEKLDGE